MSIKQFNASYLVNDDRILFRFNTTEQAEYRLWFTRRVTLFILVATSHLLTKKLEKTHSIDAAKALNEFSKQSILEQAQQQKDVSNDFQTGISFPIGPDPLLVIDVTCSLVESGEKLVYLDRSKEAEKEEVFSIDLLLSDGANLNLKLPENLMQGVVVLLDQIRVSAGWGEATLVEKNTQKNDENVEIKSAKNISIH